MRKILLVLVIGVALTTPQLAHADTMGWDITLFKYIIGGPESGPNNPTPITSMQTFYISVWDTPVVSDYYVTGDHRVLTYFGDIIMLPDGIDYPKDSIYGDGFYPGSTIWTGDPYHPDFIPGIHISSDVLGDYISVTAVEAPEPSTIGLLGTGALGLVGLFRRRLLQ